jgi:hypothetical protein
MACWREAVGMCPEAQRDSIITDGSAVEPARTGISARCYLTIGQGLQVGIGLSALFVVFAEAINDRTKIRRSAAFFIGRVLSWY